MQRGTVDCGITGTMPAYKAGWHEVTSHVLTLPVGFSVSFTIASLNSWNKLDDKSKAFIDGAIKGQTDKFMRASGLEPSTAGVAAAYESLIDGIVVDAGDPDPPPAGVASLVVPTLMDDDRTRREVAERTLEFARSLA